MYVFHNRWVFRHKGKWVQVIQLGPWFLNGNPLTRMVESIVRLSDEWACIFAFVFLIVATVLSIHRR